MGLYLLNISVDTADPNPEHFPEDLSINDQESIIEIIIEQVLGYENAIIEYDDHDNEDQRKKKNVKNDLLAHVSQILNNTNDHLTKKKTFYSDYQARLISVFLEIDSPPPKV